MEKTNYKQSLVGKWVKFRVGKKTHYGRVSHIEQDICAIRGIEQKKYTKPAYNYNFQEVKLLPQDEVFNLGRIFSNSSERLIILSPKESFLLWMATCKYRERVTHCLRAKLYKLLTNEERRKFRKKFSK